MSGLRAMGDEELLALAARIAGTRPDNVVQYVMKWAAYDAVSAELRMRAARHAAAELSRRLGLPDISRYLG